VKNRIVEPKHPLIGHFFFTLEAGLWNWVMMFMRAHDSNHWKATKENKKGSFRATEPSDWYVLELLEKGGGGKCLSFCHGTILRV
jgi:hypothetical protein